jgi:hypothetical protein
MGTGRNANDSGGSRTDCRRRSGDVQAVEEERALAPSLVVPGFPGRLRRRLRLPRAKGSSELAARIDGNGVEDDFAFAALDVRDVQQVSDADVARCQGGWVVTGKVRRGAGDGARRIVSRRGIYAGPSALLPSDEDLSPCPKGVPPTPLKSASHGMTEINK